MILCVAFGVLVIGFIGFIFGAYTGFESVTKDIGRYGFFTWRGKKYDCTTSQNEVAK